MHHILSRAEEIAGALLARSWPRRSCPNPAGFARGVDFYGERELVHVVANILSAYRNAAGIYPNLLEPELYSEKLSTLKLLGWLRIPESGNKLLTAHFIPPELRGVLRVPEVVWRSRTAVLPGNSEIPDGEYFLKANHGCGYCRRIRYPLSAADRLMLEALASRWLNLPYGLELGEWWYNVFEKAVFLEKCVTRRNPSAVMLYYTFGSKVGLISVDEKFLDGSNETRVSLYDPSFRLLPQQILGSRPVMDFCPSDEMKQKALASASAIGGQFEAVRVDLIPGDDGELYLNEVTFASNGGLPLKSRERDIMMGRMWDHGAFRKRRRA